MGVGCVMDSAYIYGACIQYLDFRMTTFASTQTPYYLLAES